ncbi:hypothetical protein ACFLUJ_04580 [Chloroflexota bacterium]
MDGLGLGLLLGFAAGIGTGITIGKQQKPWAELNEKEKKVRIIAIVIGTGLCIAGIMIFVIRISS